MVDSDETENIFPDKMNVKVSTGNKDVNLPLQRNTNVDDNVPVFLFRNGKVVRHIFKTHHVSIPLYYHLLFMSQNMN